MNTKSKLTFYFIDTTIAEKTMKNKPGLLNLMGSITSSEMMLFIISLMMILLGGYILLKPQFTKSTLMDLVDEKVEGKLHAVGFSVKDLLQKMQSYQEDSAHLENFVKQVNESVSILGSVTDYNITELGLKLEHLVGKIQLQYQKLKDLEEEGRRTYESLEEFANTTRGNITETLRQQLLLQESIQQVNESVISLSHAAHNNITVQHNSTSKLAERMEQAEKEVEKYAASAEHLQRIDHKVAQLVSSSSIPTSSLIIIISIVRFYLH